MNRFLCVRILRLMYTVFIISCNAVVYHCDRVCNGLIKYGGSEKNNKIPITLNLSPALFSLNQYDQMLLRLQYHTTQSDIEICSVDSWFVPVSSYCASNAMCVLNDV